MYRIRIPGPVYCALYALQLAFLYPASVHADEPDLKGLWSKNSELCAKGASAWDNVTITDSQIRGYEWNCDFYSGKKRSSTNWAMRGKCCNGGECNELDKIPETQLNLSVESGVLRFQEGNRAGPEYYPVKCDGSASPTRTLWLHNGSTVYLVVNGSRRQFFYLRPRPGMLAAGVSEGTLLFDGVSSGSSYQGSAFLFDKQCGSVSYAVNGPILDGGRRVVVGGRAPRLNGSCATHGYFNDALEFTLLPGQ